MNPNASSRANRRAETYSAASSARSRTLVGSTLIPGPIVDAIVMVLMYLPLADEGLARMISLRTVSYTHLTLPTIYSV